MKCLSHDYISIHCKKVSAIGAVTYRITIEQYHLLKVLVTRHKAHSFPHVTVFKLDKRIDLGMLYGIMA